MTPNTLNVAVHVTAGALALAVGLVPLFSTKGGPRHRRWGRVFVVVGGIVIGTAVIGLLIASPPMALVAATLAAGYQYVGSLRALSLRDRAPGVVDAALACTALGLAAVLLYRMGPGTASWSPTIGYSTLGYVAALVVYDLSRHFWPRVWLRSARPLDHGLKMTGAYFAMASAGAGNVLRDRQPWSQLLPSMIGTVVMLALWIVYVRGRGTLQTSSHRRTRSLESFHAP